MEEQLLIEGFRRRETEERSENQLSRLFVDDAAQERRALYFEQENFRKPFDKARIERNHLRKAIDTYKKSVVGKSSQDTLRVLESCQNFDALNRALVDERQQWFEKKRLFGGKGQEYFHNLCRTLGGHQTILDVFPDSSEYCSIFCAAFNTVIQASLNHQKTAEQLVSNLQQINEAVELASGRISLFDIESMRIQFADLYSHVLHFFVKAIDWYSASSLVKVSRSVNANYNDKFETIISSINTIKNNMADRSALGSMAEIRDINLQMAYTSHDVRLIRRAQQELIIGAQDQARRLAEREAESFEVLQEFRRYRQQVVDLTSAVNRKQLNEDLVRVLACTLQRERDDPPRQLLLGSSVQTGPEEDRSSIIDDASTLYDRATLAVFAERLQAHIASEKSAALLLDDSLVSALPHEMFSRLRSWILNAESEILWIAGPPDHHYPSKMSTVASTVINLFAQVDPVVIFCFSDLSSISGIRDDKTTEEAGIVSLVYSIVQQLVFHIKPEFNSNIDLSECRFAQLDGTAQSIPFALSLMKNLLHFCLPYIVFVIDGLERLDYDEGQTGCTELVEALRDIATSTADDPESSRLYKILFTTSGTTATLIRELDTAEILMQSGRKGSLDLDRFTLGKSSVADLEEAL